MSMGAAARPISAAPTTTEELLERAHADSFTNAVRITISALRKRLGDPGIIATVAGVGYRIETAPGAGPAGGDRG